MLNLPHVKQSLPFTCGAACFESMHQFLRGESLGEMYFAEKLGTLTLGYTPPTNVYQLGQDLNFSCEMKEDASWDEIVKAITDGHVVFVTWWDEDAGHYSLVKGFKDGSIVLMDPWLDEHENILEVDFFIDQWKLRGSRVIIFCS
jgi:predicted double-glycine peptidase